MAGNIMIQDTRAVGEKTCQVSCSIRNSGSVDLCHCVWHISFIMLEAMVGSELKGTWMSCGVNPSWKEKICKLCKLCIKCKLNQICSRQQMSWVLEWHVQHANISLVKREINFSSSLHCHCFQSDFASKTTVTSRAWGPPLPSHTISIFHGLKSRLI